jgi:D-3-phosphoglycerate dehydrogenase / 2-oxoglutarate reductase
MKIAILDDYFDTVRTLPCVEKPTDHDVTMWNDHARDDDTIAKRPRDTEVWGLSVKPEDHGVGS